MPKVKFFATLKNVAKTSQVEVQGRTVQEVLDNLAPMFDGKLERYLKVSTVLVNDKNVRYLDGERTRLKPGDTLSLYPPIGGG